MSDNVQLIRNGNYGFAKSSVGAYFFEITGETRLASPGVLPFYTRTRAMAPTRIGDFDIVPYGESNNYPDELRQVLDDNNLTPEVLNKQTQLLWGQGPALYRVKFENGKRVKYWDTSPEIENWLSSWDYLDYILKTTVEFRTINGHFTKYYRNLGARIPGMERKIVKLDHVSGLFARLEWPDDRDNINAIITGDYSQPWKKGLTRYPVFNPAEPFAHPVSMSYSNLYNFALDLQYSRSPFHGSLNWIKLASSIAKILTNFNTNSAAIRYHIQVPAVYWSQKREELIQNCSLKNEEYSEQLLETLKDDTFKKFVTVLSGIEQVGKFVTTEKIYDETAGEYIGWEILPLDQKVKDFIDAQIAIGKQAAFETTSGIGLHPALSNLSRDGNLPSGSEQLYAFKLFLATGVDIPESIVMKDINRAITINFPGTDLRLGFYHDIVMTEERTNPEDRIKNAV